jgi:hypothetical protein
MILIILCFVANQIELISSQVVEENLREKKIFYFRKSASYNVKNKYSNIWNEAQ